jgi:hypothetical protein
MKFPRFLRIALPVLAVALAAGCSDSNDVTGSGGALARLSVNAPGSAVSGVGFNVEIRALNVGIEGIHNGVVTITLAAPLAVNSVAASPGTSATFSNAASGATVTWTLNTLDSNTSSDLQIAVTGTLPAGENARTVRVEASMRADGINPGDAVAFDDVQLTL